MDLVGFQVRHGNQGADARPEKNPAGGGNIVAQCTYQDPKMGLLADMK